MLGLAAITCNLVWATESTQQAAPSKQQASVTTSKDKTAEHVPIRFKIEVIHPSTNIKPPPPPKK